MQYRGTAVGDFKDITRTPSIDAISDCSTNEMHHVSSTDALEQGKHVLFEKPVEQRGHRRNRVFEKASRETNL